MGDCNFTYKNGTRTLRKSASSRINNNENNTINNSADYLEGYETAKNIDYDYSYFQSTIEAFENNPNGLKEGLANDMFAWKDVKGEPPLVSMQKELKMINKEIKENKDLGVSYGASQDYIKGTEEGLKYHKERIENIITKMQSARKEYENLVRQSEIRTARNKGRQWL